MYTIETEQLKATINPKGAELVSLVHKGTGLDYMWPANPQFWAKHSPVLFPIVGSLKADTYYFKNTAYRLPRHGFARDREFTVSDSTADSITFSLQSDEETAKVYPFRFVFSLVYRLKGGELSVTYRVENKEEEEALLFSVGGHPAFRLPLAEGTAYEDYRLVFNKQEQAGRWPISKEGLIEKEPQPLLDHTRSLPLSKDLFRKDALVLKHLHSDCVTLESSKTPRGLQFHFEGFPFLGLWAAPGADFLCIEPWCGIADSVDSDQQLRNKEGIIALPEGRTFERVWRVRPF
ncbi:aldose 1-epimerase family protein [Paraflavisolibacter sp. H34]|uniref:aldose 1-epimerase family protein n=1 Tax=Huijunlia imazamoxiresistens TaxID=3127457 RepID=UPI003018934F